MRGHSSEADTRWRGKYEDTLPTETLILSDGALATAPLALAARRPSASSVSFAASNSSMVMVLWTRINLLPDTSATAEINSPLLACRSRFPMLASKVECMMGGESQTEDAQLMASRHPLSYREKQDALLLSAMEEAERRM